MNREVLAWLVAGIAGTCSGVVAGIDHRVTAGSMLAISAVIATATGLVTWLLPRGARAAQRHTRPGPSDTVVHRVPVGQTLSF